LIYLSGIIQSFKFVNKRPERVGHPPSHIESGLQAASVGDSHGSAVATLQVYGDLALGGTAQGVVTGGMGNPLAQGLVGIVTDAAFGAAADTVGSVKLGIDAAIFATALGYCAAHTGN
jgi:hypothetical protein